MALSKRVGGSFFGLAAVVLAGACSSDSNDLTSADIGSAVQPLAVSTAVSVEAITVRAEADNQVVVQVLPNASCLLRWPDTKPTDGGLEVVSDPEGNARFHLTTSGPTADSFSVALDCRDSSGKSETYEVSYRATADAPVLTAPVTRSGTPRPALSGDPKAYTNAELVSLGFPPRPEASEDSEAYQRWLEVVSKPATRLAGPLVVSRQDHVAYTQNWAGWRLDSEPAYTYAHGDWQVPLPLGESSTEGILDTSSLWVGLGDGIAPSQQGRGDMWQGGTEHDEYCITAPHSIHYCFRSYTPWVEVIHEVPNDAPTEDGTCCPSIIWSMALNPGDHIYTDIWIGDLSGNPNPGLNTPLYAWWYIQNVTTGQLLSQPGGWYYVNPNEQPPGNEHYPGDNMHIETDGRLPSFISFTGGSAEWILERTANDYQVPPHLAGFSTSPQIWNAGGWFDSNTSWQLYTSGSPELMIMTRTGQSSNWLADAITPYNQPDRMLFRWYAHY